MSFFLFPVYSLAEYAILLKNGITYKGEIVGVVKGQVLGKTQIVVYFRELVPELQMHTIPIDEIVHLKDEDQTIYKKEGIRVVNKLDKYINDTKSKLDSMAVIKSQPRNIDSNDLQQKEVNDNYFDPRVFKDRNYIVQYDHLPWLGVAIAGAVYSGYEFSRSYDYYQLRDSYNDLEDFYSAIDASIVDYAGFYSKLASDAEDQGKEHLVRAMVATGVSTAVFLYSITPLKHYLGENVEISSTYGSIKLSYRF